ncbi:MAG: exo-beta-N-acetylmuramidase NamZ family protein [Bacteroidia bacterium]
MRIPWLIAFVKICPIPEPPPYQDSITTFCQTHLPRLKGKKIGLVTHRATLALAESLRHATHLTYLYVPEHGLFSSQVAGAPLQDTLWQGIPIFSLYGPRKAPPKLNEIDLLVFALQDVGVRYYTYLSTLALCMQAAQAAQRPLMVLDFPNPHAFYVYGPLLEKEMASFVGLYPVPLIPGLTIGEYARFLEKNYIPCNLTVVPIKNYQRRQGWVGSLWTPPSPALQTPFSSWIYPILAWFEAAPVSVGRGTDAPFERIGWPHPPWQPHELHQTINFYGLILQKDTFTPTQPPHAYTLCYGYKVLSAPQNPDSLWRAGWHLLFHVKEKLRTQNFLGPFFDKLTGTKTLRPLIARGAHPDSLFLQGKNIPADYLHKRKKVLLYP